MENQIDKLNNQLSSIEKEVKDIQAKYTDKANLSQEDTNRLLEILDEIDQKMANLKLDENE